MYRKPMLLPSVSIHSLTLLMGSPFTPSPVTLNNEPAGGGCGPERSVAAEVT